MNTEGHIIFPYSVQMRENKLRKKLRIRTLFKQWSATEETYLKQQMKLGKVKEYKVYGIFTASTLWQY